MGYVIVLVFNCYSIKSYHQKPSSLEYVNIYYLIDPMGQKSRYSRAEPCLLRVCHKIDITVPAGALVSSGASILSVSFRMLFLTAL